MGDTKTEIKQRRTALGMTGTDTRHRLIITCAAAFFIVSSVLVPIKANIFFLGNLLLFALPGLAAAHVLFRPLSLKRPAPLLFGFSTGIIFTSFVNMAILSFWGWHLYLTYFVLIVFSLSMVWLEKKTAPEHNLIPSVECDVKDYWFLFSICLIMLVFISIPLFRVGHSDGQVHYYHSLFSHDYLMRGTTSYSIITGMPLKSYYLGYFPPGKSSYYYLCYALLACTHKFFDGSLKPDTVVAMASFWFTLPFILGLFLCVKAFLQNRTAIYLAVICGLFAYSYNGFYYIAKYIVIPEIAWLHTYLSNNTNILTFTGISHGWYRDLLVEPQAVLALIFVFVLIMMAKQINVSKKQFFPLLSMGLIMAGMTAADSALGMISVLWMGLVFAYIFIKAPYTLKFRTTVNGIICFASAYGFYYISKKIQLLTASGDSVGLAVKPFAFFWKYNILYMLVDYGPLFVFGILGIYYYLKKQSRIGKEAYLIIILGMICLFFIAFVQTLGYEPDNISRKATKLMQIPLVIFSGLCFQTILDRKKQKHILFAGMVIFLGFVTLFVDFSIFTGFADDGTTSKITRPDYEACNWIRDNLPDDSIIQSMPEYGGYYTMSPIITIGGRAMAVGNLKIVYNKFRNQKQVYQNLLSDIDMLFDDTPMNKTLQIIKKYSIQYIYIGPNEREKYHQGINKYNKSPLFERIYSSKGVDIFKIATNH